jgi:glycogen synthase
LPRLEFYPTDFPLEWMERAAKGISESIGFLEDLIEKIKPDVVHSSQFCYGALNCSIPRVVVAHSDVLSWWTAVHGDTPPESPWLIWYREIVLAGLAKADLVITPSQWMANAVSENYKVPSRDVHVIYNGREAALFQASNTKKKCVLCVGRIWDAAKQVSLLLARSHPVPVRIVGPNQRPTLMQEPEHQTDWKSPGVEFVGARSEEELCALFSESSTYAITSRYEPFGLAPVEAALSGCALVANDIPIFRELWGDAALYFRRNDPDALARAIRLLSDNPELRDKYANRAREHAIRHFDSARMVAQYEAAYGKVVGKEGAA